ncbi:MAG: glycosyltransferase family 4 protein [Anaerolineae bacterium]|jgi:glycosyltransferase involved in cell wall biosynthesis
MRILIINYEFPPIGAGGGKASFNIAKHLAAMGHRVRVITARPIEVYSYLGTFLILLGLGIGGWLAYEEITVNIDIGGEGFTTIAVLVLLSGLILRAMGLMWGLIVPFKGLQKRELIEGVEIRRVPAFRQQRESSSILEMLSFLISGTVYGLRHTASFRPDVVHVFFGIPCGPIGWIIKRVYRTPYLISLRGADVPSDQVQRFKRIYPLLKPFIRFLWRDADALVAVSNGLRDIALETSDVPIQVIPNAIDLTRFTPRVAWDRESCEDERVKLLFVGRLIRFKNVGTLLEAVAWVKGETTMPFVLEIVGDGVERPELEEQAAELGLAPDVRFRGWVDRSNIVPYYQNADLFVTASIWEGMPNTVLEAMACGLPIIASDVQGSDELVEPGKNGYLVPVRDAKAMAQAILLLVENEHERRRMGQQSRRIVQRTFAWDRIAEGYEAVYRRMLNHPEGL